MAGLAGIIISGVSCEEKNPENELLNPCSDLSQLSESDLEARRKFNYLEQTPDKNKACSECNLYLPSKETAQCGSCTLLKGPVMAIGICIYWTPAT